MAQELRSVDQAVIDRRRFLRDAAVVAWSTPVLLSVTADRAFAQTCIAIRNTCTRGTTPISGCCTGLICCGANAASAARGQCRKNSGATCAQNNECCSNVCAAGICAPCTGAC